MGKLNYSCLTYCKILKIDANNYSANLQLSKIHFELGNYAEAINSFDKCIELDNNNYLPYYYLAKIYKIKGNIVKVKEFVNLAVKYSPHNKKRISNEFLY